MQALRESRVRDLLGLARAQGWRERRTGHEALMLIPPDRTKPPVYIPCTPSDRRTVQNLEAALRRSGLRLPR